MSKKMIFCVIAAVLASSTLCVCSAVAEYKKQVPQITAVPVVTLPKTDEQKTDNSDKSLAYRINEQMNPNENYVFSPFSLKCAIAMAANGARNTTQADMLNALGYADINALNADMRIAINSYNADGVMKLKSSNSLWLNKKLPEVQSEFKSVLEDNFDAQTYKGTIKDIPGRLKKWVYKKSNGMQKDFNIKLDNSFAAAIVNTTYLKTKWQDEFSSDTHKREFTNADGTKAETDFMNEIFYKPMYLDDKVQMVRLDYMDNERDLSFYAAIADEGTDLEEYIPRLTTRNIELFMPKFKQHSQIDMAEITSKLGAGGMFLDSADFSGVFGDNTPLHISSILQDTIIDVDENGTEAVSTTVMFANCTEAVEDFPVAMHFNKPFTYFIRDNSSGEILFMGRFAKAEQ